MPINLTLDIVPLGDFPILDDNYIKGGFQIVADTTARDAISATSRKEGMLVWTQATSVLYQLGPGITNGDWAVFNAGGGGGGVTGPGSTIVNSLVIWDSTDGTALDYVAIKYSSITGGLKVVNNVNSLKEFPLLGLTNFPYAYTSSGIKIGSFNFKNTNAADLELTVTVPDVFTDIIDPEDMCSITYIMITSGSNNVIITVPDGDLIQDDVVPFTVVITVTPVLITLIYRNGNWYVFKSS